MTPSASARTGVRPNDSTHATLNGLDVPTIALRADADLDTSPTAVPAATANKPTPAVHPRAQVIGWQRSADQNSNTRLASDGRSSVVPS